MYSLDNSENIDDVKKWIEKIEKITDLDIFPITVEPKIDGLAISLFYKNGVLTQGLTRGDGLVGEDVTHNIKTIKNIPLKLKNQINNDIEIRGEIYMPKKSFKEFNNQKLKDKKLLEKLLEKTKVYLHQTKNPK
jgi:DNA ligase (NAD+)